MHRLSPRSAILLLSATVLLALTLGAFAGVDDSFDWKNNKRSLKIKISDEAAKLGGDNIKTIMQTAINNWNNITPATGWTLSLAGAGETGDVDVEVGKITDSSGKQQKSGGAVCSGFNGKDTDKLKIKFDPKPKEAWKWGQTGTKKLDPVVVAKHELSHCLRLDHEGGVDTGNLADPVTPGTHVHTPSTRDGKHARKSATITKKKATTTTSPSSAGNTLLLDWSHCEDEFNEYPFLELTDMETHLMWGPETFLNEVELEMSLAKGADVPDHWSMPGPYERFVRGMWLVFPDVTLATPALIDVQIPYFDNVEDMDPCLPEELLDLADPQYKGQVDEAGLYPVIWNPITGFWEDLMPFAMGFMVDPALNRANFQIPADVLTQFPPDADGDFVVCLGIGGPYPIVDCNGNGQDDGDDIDLGLGDDCNENWILDECDIASGFSQDIDGNGIPDECGLSGVGVPNPRFRLHGAAPNPFNPSTTITYELFTEQNVRLEIYTLRGELVTVLVDERQGPGPHQKKWSGTDAAGQDVTSGVYLLKLSTDLAEDTAKLVLSK